MKNMDWDTYFMSLVYFVAMKSKDRSTKIGAIIVGPDNEIRSTGYNSFPRGVNDNVEERQDRPLKYSWFSHAERNSIYNAARIGISVKDCVMYTNGVPCNHCAFGVINSGIKEVVVDDEWNRNNYGVWLQEAERSMVMFEEAGVKVRFWKGSIFREIVKFRNGEKI